MSKAYKVGIKVNGKWLTVGSVKENKWGNMSLGLMKNQKVLDHLQGDGWANFALFEDNGERKLDKPKAEPEPLEDEIPFVWVAGLVATGLMMLQGSGVA